MSNPCKCRVGSLFVFTGLAEFQIQTCAKSLTTGLAQQPSLYRITELSGVTEGERYNHAQSTTLSTPQLGYMLVSEKYSGGTALA